MISEISRYRDLEIRIVHPRAPDLSELAFELACVVVFMSGRVDPLLHPGQRRLMSAAFRQGRN